jgi:hypothetical protein
MAMPLLPSSFSDITITILVYQFRIGERASLVNTILKILKQFINLPMVLQEHALALAVNF